MYEVRGWDFSLEVKTQLKITHAQELTSDLMQTHHDLTAWRHSQINFKSVLIFIDLAQLHFCLAYKNSHWAIIDCHTPVILQLGEDQTLIYLIKREFWSSTSYFWIQSHFSNCSLLFDTPCIGSSVSTLYFHSINLFWHCLLDWCSQWNNLQSVAWPGPSQVGYSPTRRAKMRANMRKVWEK